MTVLSDSLWALSIWWKAAGVIVGLFVLLLIIGRMQLRQDAAQRPAASTFPLADAGGHLICRNCGKLFAGATTTVQAAREFYARAAGNELFVVPCQGCGKPSLFFKNDINNWRG